MNTFLYFNLSDLIHLNDFTVSRFKSIEVYEHADRFSGFFYNLKNITKLEIENFLLFYGANVQMLNNNEFISRLVFFISLFYSQAILYFFMLQVTIIELYMLFDMHISTYSIYLVMSIFNKRLLLEIYRFYLTFVSLYKFVDFKKFKSYVISNSFFFDSDYLYHYCYFLDSGVEGYDLLYRYYTVFLEHVFMNRLSFYEIVKLLCDSLISNLVNLLYYNKNLIFTKNFYLYKYNYIYNNTKFLVYKNFINNFIGFLSHLHEFFSFFRYYIYIYYVYILRSSKKFLLKYFQSLKIEFFKLLKYFYKKLGFNNILLYMCIFFFNEIKFLIYKFSFFKKKEIFFFKYYVNFQFFFFKFYNLFKYYFYNEFLNKNLNINNVYIRYNKYIYDFFKKYCINFNFDFLFSYNNVNIYKKAKNLYFNKIYLNTNFSFLLKLNFFFFFRKHYIFIFLKDKYFYNYLTPRSINIYCLYSNSGSNYHNTNYHNNYIYNYLHLLKNNFFIKYHSLLTLYVNFSLYDVILQLHELYKYYLYIPISLKIKSEIEDFFFLLSEEVFVEDFNYFLDDILMDIGEESELNDPEDDTEFLDNFFDDFEISQLPFFLFVEEIVSINYYIYDYINFKYKDLVYPSLEKVNFNVSWDYDFLYSKVSPFFIRKYLLYGGEYFFEYINPTMWYNWINYVLVSDLQSFNTNYYSVSPLLKFLSRRFTSYDLNRFAFGYEMFSVTEEKYSLPLLAEKFINFDRSYNEFFSDIHLLNYEIDPLFSNLEYWLYETTIITADNSIVDSGDLEGYTSLNSEDDRVLAVYSSYSDSKYYDLFCYFLDLEDENVQETFFRDFVALNETWIWWEYINQIYKKELSTFFLNNVKPNNFNDLLFLSIYNLSGLSYVISLFLKRSKTEKQKQLNILDQLKHYLVSELNINLNKSDYKQIFQDFEHYYLNWLNIYNSFLFLNDYNDLVTTCFIYEKIIKGVYNDVEINQLLNKGVSLTAKEIKKKMNFSFSMTNSYYFLRKQEAFFFNILANIFQNFLGSFYFYKNKSKLEIFWEHFFLVCIEILTSSMDLHVVTDFDNPDISDIFYYGEFLFVPERRTLPLAIEELYESMTLDTYTQGIQLYLSDLLNDVMDPYILVHKGLNMNVSLAEMVFFDLYESYMQYYADTDQTEYDEVSLSRFKFFEYDENDIRYADDNEVFANQHVDQDYFSFESFLYTEELVAHTSMSFNNFFIGETYDLYLKRYFAVFQSNLFLFGLLNKYINFFDNTYNFFNKYDSFKNFSVFTEKNNIYQLWYNKGGYKCELVYYYFLQIFFLRLRNYYISNKHLFIILLFWFFFIRIKKLNLVNKLKIFLFVFFIKYYIYIFIFLIKNLDKNKFKKLNNKLLIFDFLTNLNFMTKDQFNYFLMIFYYKLKYLYKILLNIQVSYFYLNVLKRKFNKIFIKHTFNIRLYINIFCREILYFKNNIKVKVLDIFFNDKSIYLYKYPLNSTFRSYLSTHSLYDYKFMLLDNKIIIDYLIDINQVVTNKYNLYTKIIKKPYICKNYQLFYSNINDFSFNKDLNIETYIFDNYDFIKDSFYHDYEDYLDEEEYYTDQWTGDLVIGDVTDDYEEDTYDDNAGLNYNEEELNYEFDLDKNLWILYESNMNSNYNNIYNFFDFKGYRFNFLIKHLFYYNLNFLRYFIINLFKYYKVKVPVTAGFDLAHKLLYYQGTEKNKVDFMFYEYYNFLDMATIRKDLFTNIRRYFYNIDDLNTLSYKDYNKQDFSYFLPKFVYTYQLSDVLDYFIDLNNVEISEYDQLYDFSNIIQGVSFHKDFFYLNIFSDYFNKLLFFFRYVLLYEKVYQYINKNDNKIIFFTFFFFELLYLYKKVLVYIYMKYSINLFFSKVRINYKYIFNKLYKYVYNMLINYNTIVLESNFLKNFANFFIFIPFFKFNYLKLMNKVQLIFFLFKQRLSLFSCFLFIKFFDYLLLLNLSKKYLIQFFVKLRNLFFLYEHFIFYNSYKLAKIYATYGVQDSCYFFNNLILTEHVQYKIKFYNSYYSVIYKLFVIFEFIYFCFWCIIFLFFIVKINPHIFMFTSFGARFEEPLMEGDSKIMMINFARKIFDYKFYYLLNDTWVDFWGIF